MKTFKSTHLLLGLLLLATALLWGGLTVNAAQASPDLNSSTSPSLAVTIDPVQAFSSSERAIYLTGHILCPAGASFAIEAVVEQRSSGGPIVTGFSSAPSAAGTSVATQPGSPTSTAQGSSGALPCDGAGTAWQVVAHYMRSASFKAGPADICLSARVKRGVRGHRSAEVCQTVELIGG